MKGSVNTRINVEGKIQYYNVHGIIMVEANRRNLQFGNCYLECRHWTSPGPAQIKGLKKECFTNVLNTLIGCSSREMNNLDKKAWGINCGTSGKQNLTVRY